MHFLYTYRLNCDLLKVVKVRLGLCFYLNPFFLFVNLFILSFLVLLFFYCALHSILN